MDQSIEPIYRKISYRLKAERERQKLSQDKIAELSGISRSSICAIENNAQRIHIHDLLKLCAVLKLKPFTFFVKT